MSFDNSFIDNLKAGINIVDVIGRDVRLTKAGSNYKGLCPFHNEKTPSFMVSEQKQIFTCFGCGEKGDVIEYVKRRNNMTFMEAVEKLCEDYNIEMPRTSAPRVDYNKYYEINRLAARFFFQQLTGDKNPGYAYIRKRGITDETITKFGLGFAPNAWHELHDHLAEQGVSDEDMLKLGLINKGKEGHYDKFRNRVIFPIFNTQGKVIGFGGRAIGDANPKYLNSSESDIFLKKNNLFALNFTKGDIAKADCALIVEGYMDAISLYQNGVKNVAASLGTALTENQGRLLSRFTKNVVLSYDADAAGIAAAVRGIDVMRAAGCNVRILRINDGKDPDDFIRKNGREAFERLVREAVPATDFRLQVLQTGYDLTDDMQILDYIRRCVPVLRSLGAVEQDIYIKRLASQFGLTETAIATEVRTDNPSAAARPRFDPARQGVRRRQPDDSERRLEYSFLILGVYNATYLQRLQADHIEFRTPTANRIYGILRGIAAKSGYRSMEMDRREISMALDPEEEAELNRMLDIIKVGPDDEAFYQECRARYTLNGYHLRRTELLNELQVAEQFGNAKETEKIVSELTELDDAIRKVRNS